MEDDPLISTTDQRQLDIDTTNSRFSSSTLIFQAQYRSMLSTLETIDNHIMELLNEIRNKNNDVKKQSTLNVQNNNLSLDDIKYMTIREFLDINYISKIIVNRNQDLVYITFIHNHTDLIEVIKGITDVLNELEVTFPDITFDPNILAESDYHYKVPGDEINLNKMRKI
jgi:hypothetical protein